MLKDRRQRRHYSFCRGITATAAITVSFHHYHHHHHHHLFVSSEHKNETDRKK